jgi:hypothetical protein
MNLATLVKKAQAAMNLSGAGLDVDGDWGPKTKLAATKFEFRVDAILEEEERLPKNEITGAADFQITEPIIVVLDEFQYKNRGNYKTDSGKFKGLTVHYSVSGRSAKGARGVVEYLQSMGYGCMVMDESGIIYVPKNFDIFQSWGSHSGKSKWKGIKNVSDQFAGIEICNWGKDSKVGPYRDVTTAEGYVVAGRYQQYTDVQEKSLINFLLWAKTKNPEFDLDYVVGHDELRKEYGLLGDKQDPGGSLSMTMPQLRDLIKAKALELGI